MIKMTHLNGYSRLIKTISINLPIHINIIIMKTLILLAIPGGMEWVLIAVVVLLLFGGKKIPELMKGLGKGISEFKKGKKEIEKDLDD
jgi:sec-independent protein translocase protein TatA